MNWWKHQMVFLVGTKQLSTLFFSVISFLLLWKRRISWERNRTRRCSKKYTPRRLVYWFCNKNQKRSRILITFFSAEKSWWMPWMFTMLWDEMRSVCSHKKFNIWNYLKVFYREYILDEYLNVNLINWIYNRK